MKRSILLLAVLVQLTACDFITGPHHNPRHVPPLVGATLMMPPPPRYAELWQVLLACSGLSGNFGDVTWFRAASITVGGNVYAGYWFEDWNRIVMRDDYVNHDRVVKHEMMHSLLNAGGHPPAYFNGPCGQL